MGEQRDIEVCLVFLVKKENRVLLDRMENLVILVNPVPQVFKDPEDLLVTVADLDLLDHQVHEVQMVPQDNLGHQDSLELQDRKENLDLLDLVDLKDLKENVVSLALQDIQDLVAHQVHKEMLEVQDLKEIRVTLVFK